MFYIYEHDCIVRYNMSGIVRVQKCTVLYLRDDLERIRFASVLIVVSIVCAVVVGEIPLPSFPFDSTGRMEWKQEKSSSKYSCALSRLVAKRDTAIFSFHLCHSSFMYGTYIVSNGATRHQFRFDRRRID